MAKSKSSGYSRGSYGSSNKSSSSRSSSGGVSTARLHQKSGSSNAFGGYTKVSKSDGSFTMRKTEK